MTEVIQLKQGLATLTIFIGAATANAQTAQAPAAAITASCELKSIPGESLSFKISSLNSSEMELVPVSGEPYSDVVTTASTNDVIKRIVQTLNGQGGDLRNQADRIELFGDGDGIDLVWLDLFKDSGLTKGFIRNSFDDGGDKSYSEVSCTLSK
jgi:hypothetical protein